MRNELEEIESCTKDDPFNAIFVTLPKSLPNSLFFWWFPCDTDASASSVCTRRILLYFAEFNTFRWYIMASIGKVKHAPESGIWIWFWYLEKGKIGRIWWWEWKFIDRRNNTSVSDGPFEVTRGFAADDPWGRSGGMTGIWSRSLSRFLRTRRKELCNTEIALGRGR